MRENTLLIWFLVLVNTISSTEISKTRQMSMPSDAPTNSTIIRHKRYLDFLPKSRMFVSIFNNEFLCVIWFRIFKFTNYLKLRANVKANVLSVNQVIAFAYGFRANYPIENDIRIKRRDVYDSMEEIMDQ